MFLAQTYWSLIKKQIMFNLDKVHIILDEMILNGHIMETNKNRILAPLLALDKMAEGWITTLGEHGLHDQDPILLKYSLTHVDWLYLRP